MKIVWQSLLSLTLGFAGGILAMMLNHPLNRRLSSSENRVEVVRANRFELVNSSGKTLAYWGEDTGEHKIMLAFVDENAYPQAEFGVEPREMENGRPSAYNPFSILFGRDGIGRMWQGLDITQNPVIAMGDGKSEGRLLLGHRCCTDVAGDTNDPWDNWSLVMRDPSHGWKEYVNIGVTAPLDSQMRKGNLRTGYLVLRNSLDRELSEEPK
jgi:hypothetical protein